MVPIFRPWRGANRSRSSLLAMEPSSFRISSIIAAGSKPARRTRSQPASVCPARVSTPPGWALSGNTWPGCCRSSGFASGATATRIVRARSWAELPVVIPRAASMERVKLVPRRRSVSLTISGSRQLLAALPRQRQADQPPTVTRHEIDVGGARTACGHDQVALVFAGFVVQDDDHPAVAQVGDDFLGRVQPGDRGFAVDWNGHVISMSSVVRGAPAPISDRTPASVPGSGRLYRLQY